MQAFLVSQINEELDRLTGGLLKVFWEDSQDVRHLELERMRQSGLDDTGTEGELVLQPSKETPVVISLGGIWIAPVVMDKLQENSGNFTGHRNNVWAVLHLLADFSVDF